MTPGLKLPPEFEAPDVEFWEIAAETGGAFWPTWLEQGLISIGWNEFGDLARFQPAANGGPPPEYAALATSIYKAKDGRHGSYQPWTFMQQVKPGHVVFARNGWDGICGVGVVTGDYRFVQPPLVAGSHRHAHVIPVRWLPNSGRAYPPTNRQRRTITHLEREKALTRWAQDQYEIPVRANAASSLSRNIILYGPPGTGKTWSVKSLASQILTGRDNAPRAEVEQRWCWAVGAGRVNFVTFHPGMTYEEFVEGLKPVVMESEENQGRRIAYRVEDGVFKRIALRAIAAAATDDEQDDETNGVQPAEDVGRCALNNSLGAFDFADAPPFILVLDEINRGNVSRVLGELITLIEDDKRLGTGDEQRITLPASREAFAVPPNLYVIGTMNTADRSIALLDVALRRRFTFQELAPDHEVLAEMLQIAGAETSFGAFVVAVFKRLNERLSFLLDRDHLVGHAWFRSATDILALQQIFADRVIPLLQEYFQGDSDRLAIALGHPFEHSKPRPSEDDNDHGLIVVLRHKVDEVFCSGPGDLEDVYEVAVHPAFVGSSSWHPHDTEKQDDGALREWLAAAFEKSFLAAPPSGDVT